MLQLVIVHEALVALLALPFLDEGRNEVYSRLICDDIARNKSACHSEAAEAELENLKNAENPDADAISAQQDKVDSAQSDYDNAKAETQNKQDALIDAEKQLCDVVNSADGKTLGTVPGLKEAASAEEALDILLGGAT